MTYRVQWTRSNGEDSSSALENQSDADVTGNRIVVKGTKDSGDSCPVDFFAPACGGKNPRYFTSQVSPARSSLFRSPAPRFAITSLIC